MRNVSEFRNSKLSLSITCIEVRAHTALRSAEARGKLYGSTTLPSVAACMRFTARDACHSHSAAVNRRKQPRAPFQVSAGCWPPTRKTSHALTVSGRRVRAS